MSQTLVMDEVFIRTLAEGAVELHFRSSTNLSVVAFNTRLSNIACENNLTFNQLQRFAGPMYRERRKKLANRIY
jgi:hypothetical protein